MGTKCISEFEDDGGFSKSGWTKENYQSAVHWVENAVKDGEAVHARHAAKLAAAKEWVAKQASKDNPDDAKIIRIMNASIVQFHDVENNLTDLSAACRPMLARVAKHLGSTEEK